MIITPYSNDIERTPSQAFRHGSSDAVRKVLEEVESAAKKRVKDGFSEINFTLGVFNCFVVTYTFAAFPQHLWVIYVFEAFFFFPLKAKFLYEAKPLNQILYLLDYCWIMNMAGVVALIVLFAGKSYISEDLKKHVFLAAYGTACGPLFGSTAVLPFISLVFHHLHSMTSVFIHFYPPLLFYILRWNADEVLAAWPNMFHLDHDDIEFFSSNAFVGTVFGNTIIAYLMWYIPYCIWIFSVGLDLPRQTRQKKAADGKPRSAKFDTVFHTNHRKGNCIAIGKLFWGRPVEESKKQIANNDFELRDLVAYMILHFIAAVTSILILAYPSYLSKYAHGTFLVILLIITTWRGAQRYTYYSTEMYSRLIKSKFNDELQENDQGIIHEG